MTRDYPWMRLSEILKYVPEARELGVSKVAQGRTGFLQAYKRANGNPNNLSSYWRSKRNAFVARHLPQYRKSPETRHRQKLALIIWAYNPH